MNPVELPAHAPDLSRAPRAARSLLKLLLAAHQAERTQSVGDVSRPDVAGGAAQRSKPAA